MLFLNEYTCPECGTEWNDTWSCGCDDTCPHCGERDITPVASTPFSEIYPDYEDEDE